MGKFHVFLSCDGDILIGNQGIEEYLNSKLCEGRTDDIKCIKKHKNLEKWRFDLDHLGESSIYVVNTDEDLDYIEYLKIGYAMGKKIQIIGYHDGKNSMRIHSDLEGLIRPIPMDVGGFVHMIEYALIDRKPIQYHFTEEGDWGENPRKTAEKEMENS